LNRITLQQFIKLKESDAQNLAAGMTYKFPTVSIIIVNWNGKAFISECFQSISCQTFRDFEVIFVDNGSTDGSSNLAATLASELNFSFTVLNLPSNNGFTGGNIEGLKHCSGKYIALLNNDTSVSKKWLASLVKAMEGDPEIGICASKLQVNRRGHRCH